MLARHFLLSHLCFSSSLSSFCCLFILDFVIFSGKALLVANILLFCLFLIFTFIFVCPGSHDVDFWMIYGVLFGSGDGSPVERLLATTQKCLWRFTSHWVYPSKSLSLTIFLFSIRSYLLLWNPLLWLDWALGCVHSSLLFQQVSCHCLCLCRWPEAMFISWCSYTRVCGVSLSVNSTHLISAS